MNKNKTTIAIALFLMFAMAVSLIALPEANAQDTDEIQPHAFMHVAPDPVGVGQTVNVYVWINHLYPGSALANDLRWSNYKVTITKPDNLTETINWPVVVDSTSSAFAGYTPDQVGTYTFLFEFPEHLTAAGIFLPASATDTLTVQEEPIPDPISSYPLPTEYWTRPIEGQNTDWWATASNWLGQGSPKHRGDNPARFQMDGIAPNSAHIMWSRPLGDGGIVDGSFAAKEVEGFYHGSSYQYRFYNPIIMHGRLYYDVPYGNSRNGGGYICVDLRTGEEIWFNDQVAVSGTGVPDMSFGYYYAYEHPNQHGVIPNGWLFSSDFGTAIDPLTGKIAALKLINVPAGYATGSAGERLSASQVIGPSGEHLTYQLSFAGKWLAQWNSSKVFDVQTSGKIPANAPITPARSGNTYWNGSMWVDQNTVAAQGLARVSSPAYDWNVTIPTLPMDTVSQAAIFDDVLLGGTAFAQLAGQGTPDPYTMWAVSLKPDSRGQLLWIKNYSAPEKSVTRRTIVLDPVNRVFILRDKETFQSVGYSIDDGSYMWTTAPEPDISDFEYYDLTFIATMSVTAYGRLYHAGYAGVLRCYDTKDGSLLWSYGNGGPGNSTNAGFNSPYGHYPFFIMGIGDGKLYLGAGEHSCDTPLYKGFLIRSVNATTGAEIWTLPGYLGYPGEGRAAVAIADGYFVFYNGYASQVYCVGKGPSATTVTASPKVSTHGGSVLVEGTVIDISAGTKQNEQAARFPHGVPAVSDASMGEWMEYVYMQKPKPTNVTGVEVIVSVLDPNGNCYEVGRTTGDVDGFFKLTFEPEVPGEYTVIATFVGSESYWQSHAETALYVEEAPVITEPTPSPAPLTDTYVAGFGIAMIIAIVAIGLVLILMLRKR